MDFSPVTSILIILGLLYASAYVACSETALFSLSPHKIKTYENQKDLRKQLIAHLLSHPRDLLVTVFMLNTLVNILLQNVASDMFGLEAGWGLKVIAPLFLTLIFGEIVPKYIGLQNNVSISYKVAGTIDKLQTLLSPIRKLIIALTTPISRFLFFFLKRNPSITKEEIEHVLTTSMEHGVLEKAESELLMGFLRLQEVQVKELMWPKEDIDYYSLSQPLSKLIHLFSNEGCTRIPVVKNSLENIQGVITAMDFFNNQKNIYTPSDVIPYLQKAYFVPETTSARSLLKSMDEASHILALIVDEYGSIIGLISREDLIEVVVGQIEDPKEQAPLYIQTGPHEVIASGKWELAEFNQVFHEHFESQSNMVTVGGWLLEHIGDIPKGGTKFEYNGYIFQVLAASKTRILRLYIRKCTGAAK